MAEAMSLLSSLASLQTSTAAALDAVSNSPTLLPPTSGVSLLDTKNDLFLSYLQALALRNLNVVRSLKVGAVAEDAQRLSDEMTAKLVEHRVYLERGVKPLEQKMKYQIERAVNRAREEERSAAQHEKLARSRKQTDNGNGEREESSSSDSDDEYAPVSNANAFRPGNFAASKPRRTAAGEGRHVKSRDDAVYRPPRISATSMPTTSPHDSKTSGPQRSRTLDEYITTELSAAPAAEPSIGSTITAFGRRTMNARELAREHERTNYEETHLMRLPPESKKERAKKNAQEMRSGFGGEEWRGLGDSVDRIAELTRRKKVGALERSRKRRVTEDGPRGDGREVGAAFEAKRRRVEKKVRQ